MLIVRITTTAYEQIVAIHQPFNANTWFNVFLFHFFKAASPPALPRREGAGMRKGILSKIILNVHSLPLPLRTPAPSLRGRAGGEATSLILLQFSFRP